MRETRPTTRPLRERGESARGGGRASGGRACGRLGAAVGGAALGGARVAAVVRGDAAGSAGAGAARGGARGALDDAELGHERGAAVARARVAGDDAEADLAIRGHEDVGAVAGRVHPGGHDRARGGELAGAPGEVLADPPGAAVGQVAGGADALGGLGAVAALVGEVAVGDHVVAVAEGGLLQLAVDLQRGQTAVGALGVEEAQRGDRDGGEVAAVGQHVGVGALVGGADALADVGGGAQDARVDRAGLGELALALAVGVGDRAAEAAVGDADAHRAARGRRGARGVRTGGIPRGSAAGKPEGGQQHRNERGAPHIPFIARPGRKLERLSSRRRRPARPARRAARGRRTPRRSRDRTACRRRSGSRRRRPRR